MRLLALVGALLGLAVSQVAGSALNVERDADSELFLSNAHMERATGGSRLYGRNLRILPLGASITFGYHSTDGNGYRQDLKNLLAGANVTYVGSVCSGTMKNGNNEGHPGYVISDMINVVQPDFAQKPNVVLIYVGTNDMLYPVQPATAPQRMATLVQQLAAKLPKGTLIVVGNLFLETDPVVQKRIDAFNAALPGALRPLYSQGINVAIADLSHALTKQDLFCDGEHPIDQGYAKMAGVFFNSIFNAAIYGRIPNPSPPTAPFKNCTPLPKTPIGTCTSTTTSKTSTSTSTTTTGTGTGTGTGTAATGPTVTSKP